MLSKHYESTKVDRRTWLHVPSGTIWSTGSYTDQCFKTQKGTFTKMYTPNARNSIKIILTVLAGMLHIWRTLYIRGTASSRVVQTSPSVPGSRTVWRISGPQRAGQLPLTTFTSGPTTRCPLVTVDVCQILTNVWNNSFIIHIRGVVWPRWIVTPILRQQHCRLSVVYP